jgi:hypothetical protein
VGDRFDLGFLGMLGVLVLSWAHGRAVRVGGMGVWWERVVFGGRYYGYSWHFLFLS